MRSGCTPLLHLPVRPLSPHSPHQIRPREREAKALRVRRDRRLALFNNCLKRQSPTLHGRVFDAAPEATDPRVGAGLDPGGRSPWPAKMASSYDWRLVVVDAQRSRCPARVQNSVSESRPRRAHSDDRLRSAATPQPPTCWLRVVDKLAYHLFDLLLALKRTSMLSGLHK